MIKKRTLTIVLALIMVVIIGGALGFFFLPKPLGYHGMDYSVNFKLFKSDSTVVPGATFVANLTLTSYTNETIVVPVENLSIHRYNSNVSAFNSNTRSWNDNFQQDKVYDYTFSSHALTIEPSKTQLSIVTVHVLDNAPAGCYELSLNLGSIKSPLFGFSYETDVPLFIRIFPCK